MTQADIQPLATVATHLLCGFSGYSLAMAVHHFMIFARAASRGETLR